jgi:predicted MarR family transcription regulator
MGAKETAPLVEASVRKIEDIVLLSSGQQDQRRVSTEVSATGTKVLTRQRELSPLLGIG